MLLKAWLCMIFGLYTLPLNYAHRFMRDMPVKIEWKQLEFNYATPQDRQNDIDTKIFIPGTIAPIDVDIYYSDDPDNSTRIFVTVPKFSAGVPVSLGTVMNQELNGNPLIDPYPSWEWHRNPTQCRPNRIVSVFRVMIDECGRLWVLDDGRLENTIICPPQILAFDLQTNQLIHKYEIPRSQYEDRSTFVTLVVDVRDAECTDTFIYAADCTSYSIVVYDVANNNSWLISDKTMYPYPNFGTYRIGDPRDTFDLMDGILGMGLEPYRPGKDRILYYQAMSSGTLNFVQTSLIRNQARFINNSESSPQIFNVYRGHRNTQSAALDIDKNGIMYFGLMSDITLDCWNIATDYGLENIETIADNQETLQFASGVKVKTNLNHVDELWVLTSRFQKIGAGTINPNEINFRILVDTTNNLIAGTSCKSFNHRPGHGDYGFYDKPLIFD